MKLISYLNSGAQIPLLKEYGITQVLVSCRELSIAGLNSFLEMKDLIALAREASIEEVIIEWDDLASDEKLQEQWELVRSLDWGQLYALRVRDQGALMLASECGDIPRVHFIAEAGHRNQRSLQAYLERFSPKLTRLILSPELPAAQLESWSQSLKCEKEILGFGKILLLTTPRPLLSLQMKAEEMMAEGDEQEQEGHRWEATDNSEESPHRGFYFFEGQRGTMMFLPKELSLLPHLDLASRAGIDFMRVDLRFENRGSFAPTVLDLFHHYSDQAYQQLKQSYPAPLIPGFFLANQTDRQFKNLKNVRLTRAGENFFGEVKEVARDSHVVIQAGTRQRTFEGQLNLQFLRPEGKQGVWEIHQLHDLNGENVSTIFPGQLLVAPYRSQLSTRTQLFL